MATVYLCTDTKFDRLVAIKLLNPELAAAVGADRFHREIKIATGLTHPNILPAHDSGESDGSLYYVMPFVEGESLRDKLNRERQLAVQDAIRITCEIASALHYAHSRGIVHRDIKPENILLEADHAVLADFGIARAITSAADVEALTQTGMSLGTPSYMSPEQAMGERSLDGRSDQYSLACVTYEMLAGQPPFTANTMQALVARHLAEPVPLISTVRPAVPDELEDVIIRALEKVPADRFATAGEFAEVLSGVLNTTGTWARRTSTRTAQMRTTRSNRLVPAPEPSARRKVAIVAAITVVLLGAGVGAWKWTRAGAATVGDADARRIGVLYFADESKNGELRHIADGLTESLIEQLSQISALEVISRNGVLPYRGAPVRADSVGRVLKLGTVVVGSVEPSARGARLDVRLLDATSGSRIDGKTFDVDTTNVLAFQDSVASEVAAFLRRHLGDEVRLRERKRATKSTDAWMLLQRAERRLKDADSLRISGALEPALVALADADSQLAKAETADPAWGAPPALRASVSYAMADALRGQPARLTAIVDSGLAHSERALRVDARNADALEYKGKLLYFRVVQNLIVNQRDAERALVDAESSLVRATTINRNQAGAWEQLGALHYRKPDLQSVILALQKAYEADAYLRSTRSTLVGLFYASFNLEQFSEAMKYLNEFKRRFPNHRFYYEGRLLMYRTRFAPPDIDSAWSYQSQYVERVPEAQRPVQQRRAQILVAGVLANAASASSTPSLADSARRVLLRARAPSAAFDPQRELPAVEAPVRVMLGDYDEAVNLIRDYLTVHPDHRKGFSSRVGWYWRDLQNYPKFKALVANVQ